PCPGETESAARFAGVGTNYLAGAAMADSAQAETRAAVRVGGGAFRYRVEEAWTIPADRGFGEVVAVACDSQNRVLLFARGPRPVLVFDRDAQPLASWGEGLFVRPHGIFIGPDDTVYCSDDCDHTVRAFAPDGTLRFTLGTRGRFSDTGATSND